MSPFFDDFKELEAKYSLDKGNFPKTDDDLGPKREFLEVSEINIPLSKEFRIKIYPCLRIFCHKYTLA